MILPASALRNAAKATKLVLDEKGIPKLFKQAPVPEIEPPPFDFDQVATRLDTAKLSDYREADPWQPNFDKLETTDDIKGLIAEEAQRLAPSIQKSRRGVLPDVELGRLASDLSVDGSAVREVLTRQEGGTLRPETIVAARRTVLASAERIKGLAVKIRQGQATDMDQLRFRHQVEFHKAFFEQFMGARAETGRALRAFGIPVREGMSEAEARQLAQIAENLNGKSTQQLALAVSEAETPAQVSTLIRDTLATKGMNVAQEVFINSILSGPTTHVVNAGGTAMFGVVMAPIERGIAAQVGKFTGSADRVYAGEATAQIVGMLSAVKDGIRMAAHVAKSGTALDGISKFETGRRALSSEYLEQSGAVGKAIDVFGTFIRAPTERVMAPTDAFFKVIAARGELTVQGYRKAFEAAAADPTLTQAQLQQIVADYVAQPPRYAIEQAEAAALYSTFQTPMGTSGRKVMSGARELFPPIRLVMPFVQTPANIFKAAWADRSALGLFSARIRADIAAGGARRDLAITRMTMGSGLSALVGFYAVEGKITGHGPSDPAERKLLMDSGWRPYSIVHTNEETGAKTYVSYARGEPLAYIIGATADFMFLRAKQLADDPLKDDDQNDLAAANSIVAAISQNTLSKSFMAGMADFISVVDDPERYAKSWAQRMGGAFIPYSAFRRQISQVQDPIVREAWTFIDQMRAQSGIPGMSESLPPRRDIFGDPVRYDQGGSLVRLMAAAMPVSREDDVVMQELVRVMDSSREVPVAMPGKSIQGVRLTAAEYSRLLEISRKELKPKGKDFRETLLGVMVSNMYLEAPTDWARATVLREITHQFDEGARKKLISESKDLQDRIIREQIATGKLQQGEKRIEDLLRSRGLDQYLDDDRQ